MHCIHQNFSLNSDIWFVVLSIIHFTSYLSSRMHKMLNCSFPFIQLPPPLPSKKSSLDKNKQKINSIYLTCDSTIASVFSVNTNWNWRYKKWKTQNSDFVIYLMLNYIPMHNYACTSSCFLFIFLDYGVLEVNHSSFVVHIQDKISHLVVHYIIKQSWNSIKTIMSHK